MGLRFPEQAFGGCFFVTTSFHEMKRYGDIPGIYEALAKSLIFCLDKYTARLISYVFMPSHIHFIVVIDGKRLGDFMRDFKKYVAQKEASDFGIRERPIWQYRYDRSGRDNVRTSASGEIGIYP